MKDALSQTLQLGWVDRFRIGSGWSVLNSI